MPTFNSPPPFYGWPPLECAPPLEPQAPVSRSLAALLACLPPIAPAPEPPYCAACSNLVTGNRMYHAPEQCPKGGHGEVIRSARDVLEAAGYIVIAPLGTP